MTVAAAGAGAAAERVDDPCSESLSPRHALLLIPQTAHWPDRTRSRPAEPPPAGDRGRTCPRPTRRTRQGTHDDTAPRPKRRRLAMRTPSMRGQSVLGTWILSQPSAMSPSQRSNSRPDLSKGVHQHDHPANGHVKASMVQHQRRRTARARRPVGSASRPRARATP